MSFFIRYFYVPLLLVGFNGFAIWLLTMGYNWWWLALLYPGAVLISLAAEHIRPYHSGFNKPNKDIDRDILYAFTYELSILNSVALLPVFSMIRPWESIWPHHWPLWQQVMAAILIADFGFMFVHYLSHKFPLLWRFHAPHHSIERLYSFNGLIKHPVQITVEVVVASTPLILLGISQEIALLMGFAAGIQLLLQHSNAKYELGPFKYVLAIAPVHRFHHVKDGEAGNVNFGLFLCLWDHLLGTFKYENKRAFSPGDFGIGDSPDYPQDWATQMVYPFEDQTEETQITARPAE